MIFIFRFKHIYLPNCERKVCVIFMIRIYITNVHVNVFKWYKKGEGNVVREVLEGPLTSLTHSGED